MRVFRHDVSTLADGIERTSTGGLRIPATLTRTGVFVYRNSDGSERRELRLPAEVFAPESMRSLRGVPVTLDHPATAVRADNWRDLARGHVGDDIRKDEATGHVDGDVVLHDAQAVSRVDTKEVREVSCGYDVDLEMSEGEYNGERYDAIQRNIRYNHVALGPKGWGRAGTNVALHVDSAYSYSMATENMNSPVPNPGNAPVVPIAEFERVRADGDTARGALAAAQEKVTGLEKALATANARLDAVDRTNLLASVADLLPKDFRADGKSTRDIKVAAIQARKPDFKADGKSDEWVDAYLEAMPRKDAEVNTLASLSTPRADAGTVVNLPEDRLSAAQKRSDARGKAAFRRADANKEGK